MKAFLTTYASFDRASLDLGFVTAFGAYGFPVDGLVAGVIPAFGLGDNSPRAELLTDQVFSLSWHRHLSLATESQRCSFPLVMQYPLNG
jgi:hypothetical protein